jgi:hypothetical protein
MGKAINSWREAYGRAFGRAAPVVVEAPRGGLVYIRDGMNRKPVPVAALEEMTATLQARAEAMAHEGVPARRAAFRATMNRWRAGSDLILPAIEDHP